MCEYCVKKETTGDGVFPEKDNMDRGGTYYGRQTELAEHGNFL